jgi:CRP/FNR family transcriptional regulator
MVEMTHSSHTACVSLVPIFNHLDNESMAKIATKANHRDLKRGEFLYQAGDAEDSIYIVHKGQVRVFHLSEGGKEQLIRVLNPGEFTGEWTLFSSDTYHENFGEATKNSAICVISRQDLQELLKEYPEIAMKIMQAMSERLSQSEKQTASVATESVVNRIIYYLEDLTSDASEDDVTITLPMARKDIASYLGTTPETLSRRFKGLEEKGLIEQLPKNTIRIPSVEELLFGTE